MSYSKFSSWLKYSSSRRFADCELHEKDKEPKKVQAFKLGNSYFTAELNILNYRLQ